MALRLGAVPPLLVKGIPIPHLPFQFIFKFSFLSTFIVILCILFTALLYRLIHLHSQRGTTLEPVDEYKKRSELLSTYLLVYVFVFAGLQFTKPLDVGIFVVFFVMLGVLQINSEMLHVNPMLGIRGFQVYEVKSGNEVMLVIADEELEEKLTTPHSSASSGKKVENIKLVQLGTTTYLATSYE